MSDEKFDAIVVGAGVAGTVAGYVMAQAGLDVLVIERGNSAGSKNMTGGRLYAHSLERIMPGFAQEIRLPEFRPVTISWKPILSSLPMASTLCWGGPWGWFRPLLHITMPLA